MTYSAGAWTRHAEGYTWSCHMVKHQSAGSNFIVQFPSPPTQRVGFATLDRVGRVSFIADVTVQAEWGGRLAPVPHRAPADPHYHPQNINGIKKVPPEETG